VQAEKSFAEAAMTAYCIVIIPPKNPTPRQAFHGIAVRIRTARWADFTWESPQKAIPHPAL
jgi:hypothetical protein